MALTPQRPLWDWRFLVSLAMIIAVIYIIISGIEAQVARNHERAAEAARTQALIGQISALENQTAHLERTQERSTAIFEDNQHRMLAYVQDANARQADLLRYLHLHGIHLPVRFLTPVRAPRLLSLPTRSTRHHRRTRTAGSPAPAPQPGKSGRHRRHRHH